MTFQTDMDVSCNREAVLLVSLGNSVGRYFWMRMSITLLGHPARWCRAKYFKLLEGLQLHLVFI